jgi:electron transfer flavoprotein alpha subunit
MSGILVIAETRRGKLREVSLELLSAGIDLKRAAGGELAVATVAANAGRYLQQLTIEGVDEMLVVAAPTEDFEAHVAQAALEALIDELHPTVVLMAQSVDSLGFAPAVAARGGHGFASDVTGLAWDDGPVARREVFGGKLEAELDFADKSTTIALVRPGVFSRAAEHAGAAPPSRELTVAPPPVLTEHRGFEEAQADDVDVTKADFIVAIGRGVEDENDVADFEELAQHLGATLCASRPPIEAGWLPRSRGVGQSGKTVKPRVYLALGISGAAQHIAGMRNAETIIAVNTDPKAPIFSVAHYGAVADLYEVAEALHRNSG